MSYANDGIRRISDSPRSIRDLSLNQSIAKSKIGLTFYLANLEQLIGLFFQSNLRFGQSILNSLFVQAHLRFAQTKLEDFLTCRGRDNEQCVVISAKGDSRSFLVNSKNVLLYTEKKSALTETHHNGFVDLKKVPNELKCRQKVKFKYTES